MTKQIIACFAFLLLFCTCSKSFLETEPLGSSLTSDSYNTPADFGTALNGCYSGLQDKGYYGRNLPLLGEVLANNVKPSPDNLSRFTELYNFSHTSSNIYLKEFWKSAYQIINGCNKIIYNVNKSEILNPEEKTYYLSHAHALRAMCHLDLFKVFSEPYLIAGKDSHLSIPLILDSTFLNPDTLIGQSTSKVVMDQIISDLEYSLDLFEDQDFDVFYLNKYSVQGLLARSYFIKGEYTVAANYANEIIQSQRFSLEPEETYISSLSLGVNEESIFVLKFDKKDFAGTESFSYMYNKDGYGDFVPSDDLINLFSIRDIRRKLYSNGFCEKYPTIENSVGLNNFPIMRLSEMYLIVAEALQTSSQTEGLPRYKESIVIDLFLDPIKKRANSLTPKTELSGSELLIEIKNECQREFAFEGHRFFNLKRRIDPIVREDCQSKICRLNFYGSDRYLYTMPFPISEINANEKLIQYSNY